MPDENLCLVFTIRRIGNFSISPGNTFWIAAGALKSHRVKPGMTE
jgi:hypothetical protein